MGALTGIATGFGLSTAAGLNAYLPLLIVALVARLTTWIKLEPPYDVLTSWWAIGVLLVLLTVEIFVDKIPAVDSVNDVIQTAIRPAAGAVLFAANTRLIDMPPVVALAAGLLLAGLVHAGKASARPIVTGTSGGLLNPVVSLVEDILSAVTSVLAIFAPMIVVGFVIVVGALFARWVIGRKRARTAP